MIAGEVVQDFKIDGHDEPCSVLRRSCVKKPPQTLMVMLNRFDIDYTTFERIKLNDYFAFTMELALAPYTKEGLARADGKPAGCFVL